MLSSHIVWGVAGESLPGETESGDQYLVKELPHSLLVAVADGLGHGNVAALAAKTAMNILKESESESLADLINLCDDQLKETRGAAITLVQINSNFQVSWLGIGNVRGVHWKKHADSEPHVAELLPQGGIVGMNMPKVSISKFTAQQGDTLILATDGIFNEFSSLSPMSFALPQTIADYILKNNRNPKDDALVLVLRWVNMDMDINL